MHHAVFLAARTFKETIWSKFNRALPGIDREAKDVCVKHVSIKFGKERNWVNRLARRVLRWCEHVPHRVADFSEESKTSR